MIDEAALHSIAVKTLIGLAAVVAILLMWISAPYGRYVRSGFGPMLPARAAFITMELPASLGFIVVFSLGTHRAACVPLLLLSAWQLHYLNRTFIYPFRVRSHSKKIPLLIVVLGLIFNSLNAYVNARWISQFGNYPLAWLRDPRLWLGAVVFAVGMAINLHSDTVLLNLRKPGEEGYKIPKGGLYRHVTCPNYFGELIEWLGWAIATWSLAGLSFLIFTAANLIPRALENHRWYSATFEEYPKQRKALIPGVI